jgi:hypothetical protein
VPFARGRSVPAAGSSAPTGGRTGGGNMRSLGVRSLFVTCELCHHEAVLSAERWGDAMLVREFRPRMVCTRCGMVGADARPNWRAFTVQGK